MSAIVCQVINIEPHPNADRLELIHVSWPVRVESSSSLLESPAVVAATFVPFETERIVTGPHYRIGQLGVYIAAGQQIPGWLAKELWMVGAANTEPLIPVVAKNMRGITSPGVFCGSAFQNDRTSPWQTWDHWNPDWRVGQDVSASLGVVDDRTRA